MEICLMIIASLLGLFAASVIIAKAFFSGNASDEEVERRLANWNNREKHDV